MPRTGYYIALLVAALCGSVAWASTSNEGVDDWDSKQVAKFLKKSGVKGVTPARVEELGLTPYDLFDNEAATEEMLEIDLDIGDPKRRAKVMDAIEKLDDSISEEPGDFFEWRMANLRLFHFWCLPMAMHAPRTFIIWLRYYHDEETDKLGAFKDMIESFPSANTTAAFEALAAGDVKSAFRASMDFWDWAIINPGT